MGLQGLAPWDLLPYFRLPVETFYSTTTDGQKVVTANPMRWGLIFSTSYTSTMGLTTNAGTSLAQGVIISQTNPTYMMTTDTHGPLPTLSWYVSVNGSQLTVIELILQSWPNDDGNHLASITPPPVVTPAIVLPTAPGVGGSQGILSYWQSLMAKIKPK